MTTFLLKFGTFFPLTLIILLGETVTDASMMAQTKTAAATTTDCTANERSRRGKHVQTGHLSDEEGSYQALSVVFEDNSNHMIFQCDIVYPFGFCPCSNTI